MNNFQYQNPTKILFGKGQIASLDKELPRDANILLLYGGGSIKRNGIYEQVIATLGDRKVVEFGGIPANPEYAKLMEALKVIRELDITYILAVGGGSVIDGAKFLSAAARYTGDDPWKILTDNISVKEGLPFATVLTLPATGSEMNSGSVITRAETKEKLAMGGPGLFPVFSILDPEVIHSIPQRQLANGITDAFTHVLEQYMTYPTGALLQDRLAESILQTLIEVAPKVLEDPTDYTAASNFMWSCTMALNGLISKGVPTDWAVHAMGHELTALYGIDHARTLAIVAPSHYTYNFEAKREKLAQYGERVWNITEGSTEERARAAIVRTEDFFHQLGIDTKLSDYTDDFEGTGEEVARRFTERGWKGLGEHRSLTPSDAEQIVKMAY